MSRRGWWLGLLGVVVLVALLVLSPRPTAPWAITSTAPNGTDILRRILADEFGVEMIETGPMSTVDGLRPADLVVVFENRLDVADETAIARHVASGGRAIIAVDAPSLTGVSRSGGDETPGQSAGGQDQLSGTPDCDLLPGTSIGFRPGPYDEQQIDTGIDVLEVPPDGILNSGQVGDVTVEDTCWVFEDGAYLVALADPSGGGLLVLSSPVAVSNAFIAGRSGTTALVPLFVPDDGGRVLVVRGNAVPIPNDTSEPGAVPSRLAGAITLLVMAGLLYVAANFRRLGPVLTEEPVVRVPAAELAVGVADLLQRHHHAKHAADHVRAGLRADLDRMLGTTGATDDAVATMVTRTSGLDEQTVHTAVAELPVADDVDLVAVVNAVHLVRDRLGLAEPAARATTPSGGRVQSSALPQRSASRTLLQLPSDSSPSSDRATSIDSSPTRQRPTP